MVLRFKIYYLDGGKKKKQKQKFDLNSIISIVKNFTNFEQFKNTVDTIGNINFEEKDEKGNTLIHLAIEHNNLDLIKYLFDNNKVQINTKNDEGKIPLDLAIEKNKEITEDNNGETPLDLAIEKNNKNQDIINFLIDKGGFNIKNETGNTPLHLAIINNDLDEIKFLINKTNLDIQNNNKKTPLQLGFELKNIYIINFLIDQVNEQGENPLLELVIKQSYEQGEKQLLESAIQQSNNEQSKILDELLKSELPEIKKIELLKYFKDKEFEVVKEYFKNLDKKLSTINGHKNASTRIKKYEEENLIYLYKLDENELDNLLNPFKNLGDIYFQIYITNIKTYFNFTKNIEKEQKKKEEKWGI
jgi:ankyrin repeat protein